MMYGLLIGVCVGCYGCTRLISMGKSIEQNEQIVRMLKDVSPKE